MKKHSENIKAQSGRKNIFGSMFGLGVVCFIASLIMVIQGIAVQPEINANSEEIEILKAEIEVEKEKKAEVERMSQNSDSDEYIEKVARDRLGMVKKDEIVFIDVSEKQ